MVKNLSIVADLEHFIEDYRLDKAERSTLNEALLALDVHQKRHLRNQAFDLVRARITQGEEPKPLLAWLEKIVKVIEQSYAFDRIASEAFFSPGDACRDAIIQRLQASQERVDICVFTISDNRLSETIIDTYRRGVAVRVITDNDKAFDKGSDVFYMQDQGVPLCVDTSPNHMHHKFALIDQYLVNGSFNWTRSASERNQENILITDNRDVIDDFDRVFNQLWDSFSTKR